MFDTEKFILEVQKHPHLWDSTHEDFDNRPLRSTTWQHVAARMVDDWDTMSDLEKSVVSKYMQSKWKNVKDHLRKSLLNKEKCKSSRKKYMFSDILGFLAPHCNSKRKKSNEETIVVKKIKTGQDKHECLDDAMNSIAINQNLNLDKIIGTKNDEDVVIEKHCNKIQCAVIDNKKKPRIEPKTSSTRLNKLAPKQKNILPPNSGVASFTNIANEANKSNKMPAQSSDRSSWANENNINETTEDKLFRMLAQAEEQEKRRFEDEDMAFLMSFLPHMKRLKPVDKLKIRIELMQVVRRYMENQIMADESGPSASVEQLENNPESPAISDHSSIMDEENILPHPSIMDEENVLPKTEIELGEEVIQYTSVMVPEIKAYSGEEETADVKKEPLEDEECVLGSI